MIVTVGIPLDENSSFLKGAALAPEMIRAALQSDSSNKFSEDGLDLGSNDIWFDGGDLRLTSMPHAFREIESGITKFLNDGHNVISLGGDHSITYPIIKAFASKYSGLNILHIDAHADLYDVFEGSRLSHACPFARIMEEKLASRLTQVGIRTLNQHQRDQIKRFQVKTYEMKDWRDDLDLKLEAPLYISLDLDALDPAFVPGVSHYEPGGFTTRQVISILRQAKGKVVGADIVELNPSRDYNDMTAMVAAKFFKEIVSVMHK